MLLDINITFRSNVHVHTTYLHCPVVRPLFLAPFFHERLRDLIGRH